MALEYLHFNIFGLALSDMATGTGSLSHRLRGAFINYFHKISWEKDLEHIPDDYKKDFIKLRILFYDDIHKKIEKERMILKATHKDLSDELIGQICNFSTVVNGLHWRKAKKIAELISHIYFGLGFEIRERKHVN